MHGSGAKKFRIKDYEPRGVFEGSITSTCGGIRDDKNIIVYKFFNRVNNIRGWDL